MRPVNASGTDGKVTKLGKKNLANAASIGPVASGPEASTNVAKSDKQLVKKNSKKSTNESKVKVSGAAIVRQRRDLMTAAGHKKYHLVKKKPKTKKIKMEVYEPKMKYKKIKMKVPIKVLKKKKVKGYMVKKKHY